MRRLKILLLQARQRDDAELRREVQAFSRACGLAEEQFVSHDLLAGPPTVAQIRAHDALMAGGSGEYYVSEANLPGFPALLEVLAEAAEAGHPTFASCFGFQLLVSALGGHIVHDPETMEIGTYPLELTPEGRSDPIFGSLPEPFKAQLGRKDRAALLPPGASNLAFSAVNPHQAMRLDRKPVWAAQFHPELDRDSNRARFLRYLKVYGGNMTPRERQEALDRYDHSPEAGELLRRFLHLVFG